MLIEIADNLIHYILDCRYRAVSIIIMTSSVLTRFRPKPHLNYPIYLAITIPALDSVLTYKKAVNLRYNINRRLNSTFISGTENHRLALCFSTCEYACPEWHRCEVDEK